MTRKVLAVFLAFLFTAAAWGQNATTSLRGEVTDPSGALVPGATVTLTSKVTKQTATVTAGKSDNSTSGGTGGLSEQF